MPDRTRYGTKLPEYYDKTIIEPEITSIRDRYARGTPLEYQEPIIIDANTKFENGELYTDSDIPMVLRHGQQYLLVDLDKQDFKIGGL